MELDEKLKEFERKRNENLERVKLEILEKVDISIGKRIDHLKPSPDTINMVNNLEKQMGEKIHEVKEAVEKRMDKFELKLDSLVSAVSCMGDKFVAKDDYKTEISSINRILEKLKAFRWQLVAGGSVALYVMEKIWK